MHSIEAYMRSASQLLHAHKGSPAVPDASDVPIGICCWVCGHLAHGRAVPRKDWNGKTFTGQNRVRAPASDYVCEACVWAMSGKPPDTLRLESHLFECGTSYVHVNKGAKPAIRTFLRARHAHDWFGSIADSGQKHVVPWTAVNPGGSRGGIVLFEERIVTLPSDDTGWGLVDAMTILLTAGATKTEVESGDYKQWAWTLCADQVRAFEASWGAGRSSPFFSLAIWLAQRDEAVVAERMAAQKVATAEKKAKAKPALRTTKPSTAPKVTRPKGKKGKPNDGLRRDEGAPADTHGRSNSGDAIVVSPDAERERVETLGSDRGQDPVVLENNIKPRRMGDFYDPKFAPGSAQRTLF